jgi:subtilisin family serine protease
MAEQKNDPGQAGKLQSRRENQSAGTTEQSAVGTSAAGTDKTSDSVVRRKQRYMFGFRSLPGITSIPADPFLERLSQMDGVEIIRRMRPRRSQTLATTTPTEEIVVARMDERRGEALRQNAPPHVIVEVDALLDYSEMAVTEPVSWQFAAQAMPFPRPRREIRFRILGEGDRPLANAGINLYGPGCPAQAITDASGHATVQTGAVDGAGIVAVYVRPAADHWERYIQNPSLETASVNVIHLSPLDRNWGRFPGERPHSWGQRMMKFDRISADWNGAGIKIGLIDSGCDSSHPILRHIVRGVDLTGDGDPESWKSDELGYGTHCAGIIAGAAAPSSGIIGCAPESEVHVFKVAPGGYFSDLIDAVDQCIERRLDLVQVGVCGGQFSELVAQKITEARLNGIACIAGAGNSGGAVQFPGNVPGVLTVSAVGKLGEYPQDTRHAQRALPQLIGLSGIYATNFSCWGPQVAVCAPGIAIVSSVPGGGYAAWDGTSMAASHVAGFAALLLSHHPLLQSINYGGRAEQRVSALFDLIRAAAIPYAQVDPSRVGAGLPDLQQVPALLPSQFYRTAVGLMQGSVAPLWSGTSAYGDLQPSLPGGGGITTALPPMSYLGNHVNAVMQLRAAGLWI